MKKKNCLFQTFYDNGKLEWSCNFIDGQLNGLKQSFYENGQLKESCNYIDGKANGLFQIFHNNGQLELSGNYIDGQLNGLSEWFYGNGKLRSSYFNKIEDKGFNRIKFYKKKKDSNHILTKEHLLVYGNVQAEKHLKPEDKLKFFIYYPQFKHLK